MRAFKASFKFLVSASDLAEVHAEVKRMHDMAKQLLSRIEGIAQQGGLHISADEEIKRSEGE